MSSATRTGAVSQASMASDASSELSSVPSDFDDGIVDMVEEAAEAARKRNQKQEAGKEGPDKEMTAEEGDEEKSDHAPPSKPRPRVKDIERELKLSAEQGRQLHDLIRDEMKKADILGAVNFSPKTRAQHEEQVDQIINTARCELKFLEATDIGKDKLKMLLLARLMIVNSNEKHNDMMVRTGRVGKRAIESRRGSSNPEKEEQAPANGAEKETLAPSAINPDRSRRSTQGPSILAATMRNLDIGEQQEVSADNKDAAGTALPNESVLKGQTAEPAPTFRTDVFQFFPTAFLIRIINSRTGAAVHTSELVSAADHSSATSIDDVSYETFIENVSHQVGFDVRERISAIVPISLGCGYVQTIGTVKLASEKEWKAMLQLWQNAQSKTCECVIEQLDVEV